LKKKAVSERRNFRGGKNVEGGKALTFKRRTASGYNGDQAEGKLTFVLTQGEKGTPED